MADSVEIQFVDESEYQNEGKWYFWIGFISGLHWLANIDVSDDRKAAGGFNLSLNTVWNMLESSPSLRR